MKRNPAFCITRTNKYSSRPFSRHRRMHRSRSSNPILRGRNRLWHYSQLSCVKSSPPLSLSLLSLSISGRPKKTTRQKIQLSHGFESRTLQDFQWPTRSSCHALGSPVFAPFSPRNLHTRHIQRASAVAHVGIRRERKREREHQLRGSLRPYTVPQTERRSYERTKRSLCRAEAERCMCAYRDIVYRCTQHTLMCAAESRSSLVVASCARAGREKDKDGI